MGIGLLVLAALYTVSILRGERGEEEAGEDVDLEGGAHWPTVVQLVALVALNVLLIDFLGWAITGALLFAGGAWVIGSRTPVRDLAIGAVLSVGSWYAFYVGLGVPLPRCARRDPLTGRRMDTLNLLMDGFSTALTPQNLMYAAIGVLLGTAVGVLRASARPCRSRCSCRSRTPSPGERAHHVRRHLLRRHVRRLGDLDLAQHPGESSSVITAIEGNKMAKAGRAAQALATAAIGSFLAGTIGTLLIVLCAPFIARVAVNLGSPSYFALMVLAMVAVTSVLGASKLRGMTSLFLGLSIGLVGVDKLTGQSRMTLGLPC